MGDLLSVIRHPRTTKIPSRNSCRAAAYWKSPSISVLVGPQRVEPFAARAAARPVILLAAFFHSLGLSTNRWSSTGLNTGKYRHHLHHVDGTWFSWQRRN